MDLNELFKNTDVLRWLATVVAGLGIAGLGILIAEFGVAKPVIRIWKQARGYANQAIELIDEPTDAANVKLQQVTLIPAEAWAVFLPVFFKALASGMDEVAKNPPKEAVK